MVTSSRALTFLDLCLLILEARDNRVHFLLLLRDRRLQLFGRYALLANTFGLNAPRQSEAAKAKFEFLEKLEA